MNRVLYQLSYAAMFPALLKISFVIISTQWRFVKRIVAFFLPFGKKYICKNGAYAQKEQIMNIWRKGFLFALGGSCYFILEMLWRGWSHGSMFFAGGGSFLLLGQLEKTRPRLPFVLRGLVGAGIVTMVELAAGLLVNRRHSVWDYRNMPGNFHGQICLPFSLLWIPVSLFGMMLYGKADAAVRKM